MNIGQRFTLASGYFLFLLPLFFVLHGYTENYSLVTLPDAASLLALYCVSAALFAAVFFLFFRSWRKAALYTTALFAFHFFFGSMHDVMKHWFANAFLSKYIFIIPLAFLLFVIFFIYLTRSKRSFVRLIKYLNTVLLVLLLIESFTLGM